MRQFLEIFGTPTGVWLCMAAIGLIFWVFRRKRMACWIFMASAVFIYSAALPPVGDMLLAPLEQQYTATGSIPQGIKTIVVLGSSYSPRAGVSAVAALDEDGLVRVVEGIRLARQIGNVRLVVSGGAPLGRTPSAWGYAQLACELGIDPGTITIMDWPQNTREEARSVAKLMQGSSFLLVTSAFHMPRAMRLMSQSEAHAIPIPTGQRTGIARGYRWPYFLPTSAGLRRTELAMHEYLGLAAMDLHIG